MFSRFFKKEPSNSQPEAENSQPQNSTQTFSNLSAEKLKAVIISLNQADPIFQRAGYIMEQLDVEFGNSPKLNPHFRQIQQIDTELFDAILLELDELQLIKFILISLHKSSRMQSLFENSELYYYGMEIDISNTPTVRATFKRKEAGAEVVPLKSDN